MASHTPGEQFCLEADCWYQDPAYPQVLPGTLRQWPGSRTVPSSNLGPRKQMHRRHSVAIGHTSRWPVANRVPPVFARHCKPDPGHAADSLVLRCVVTDHLRVRRSTAGAADAAAQLGRHVARPRLESLDKPPHRTESRIELVRHEAMPAYRFPGGGTQIRTRLVQTLCGEVLATRMLKLSSATLLLGPPAPWTWPSNLRLQVARRRQ